MTTLRSSTTSRGAAFVLIAMALAGCGSDKPVVAHRPTPRPTPTATPPGGPPAVAPWSSVSRRVISKHFDYSELAGLSYAPRGGGVVMWGNRDDEQFRSFAAVGAHNAIGAPHSVPAGWALASAPQWTTSGDGTVLLMKLAAHHRRLEAVGVATITAAAKLGPIQTLANGTLNAASLAGDAAGNVVVAWTSVDRRLNVDDETYAPYRLTMHAQLHAAGAAPGSFTPVATLLDEPTLTGGDLDTAMGAGGHAVVAMTVGPAGQTQKAGARVVAWSGTPATGLGEKQVLGGRRSDTRLTATGTSSGLVVVAWGTQAAGQEADSPWVVRAAALAPGDLAFSPTQIVDHGGEVESTYGDVFLAPGPRGTASLAWTTIRHEHESWPVVVATTDATGTFQPYAAALDRAAAVNGFAVDPRTGAALVTVRSADESAKGAFRAASGKPFGPLEPIAESTASQAGPDGNGPIPTFDPSGVPAVAFTHETASGGTELWIQSRQP